MKLIFNHKIFDHINASLYKERGYNSKLLSCAGAILQNRFLDLAWVFLKKSLRWYSAYQYQCIHGWFIFGLQTQGDCRTSLACICVDCITAESWAVWNLMYLLIRGSFLHFQRLSNLQSSLISIRM